MLRFLVAKRSLATKPAQAAVHFPMGSPYPTLTLPLKSHPSPAVFPLRPWYTCAQLASVIKEEDTSLKTLRFYHTPETPDQQTHKWASSATVEDVLRAGFQVKSKLTNANRKNDPDGDGLVSTPGFYIEVDGERLYVAMPSFEERTMEHRQELEHINKQLGPLEVVKHGCDKKAASHAERLVWGGFIGLMSQWLVLGRLTWWEYSWDVIEPITWFVNMGNTIAAYAFFMIYRRDFSCEELSNLTATKRQISLYKKRGLDLNEYSRLLEQKKRIESDIERIRLDYE